MLEKIKDSIVETGCTFEMDGQKFTESGALVAPDRTYGYPAKPDGSANTRLRPGLCGDLNSWNGEKIGRYVVKSIRKTPESWESDYIAYIDITAKIGDKEYRYHGSTAGVGMLASGKRYKSR